MLKFEEIYKDLKARAEVMQTGVRFPSVRQLMREYSASQGTVSKALERLKREGALVAVAASGLFKGNGQPGAARGLRLGLMVHDFPSEWIDLMIADLTEFLLSSGHFPEVIRYPWQDGIRKKLCKPSLDAYMIFPAGGKLETSEVAAIDAFGKPVVLCSFILYGLELDAVSSDSRAGAMTIASHLYQQGHRKTGVVYCEPHSQASELRVNGYVQAARLLDMEEPEVIDCGMKHGEDSCLQTYHFVRRLLDQKRFPEVTALFAVSDNGALGLLKALHEKKLRIPEDISVAGFDNNLKSSVYQPALTTVGEDMHLRWRHALEIIEKRINGYKGPAIQISTTPYLVERESVCTPARKHKTGISG